MMFGLVDWLGPIIGVRICPMGRGNFRLDMGHLIVASGAFLHM